MRFPFQCENIRFRNLNIFENFEHVYRRHPFDVLLPVREKYFLSPHFITINTTQFPFWKIYVDRQTHCGVYWEKTSEKYSILLNMAHRFKWWPVIRKRIVPMRENVHVMNPSQSTNSIGESSFGFIALIWNS